MTETHSAAGPAAIGREPFRPRAHFTPRRNWINDPNGLVFFDGEYHLFYQYNPQGMEWGNMCWGHAVSTDLAQWRELPVAIPETDQMIFSGSIVVDHEDVSGLGDGTAPPLIAIFTAYDAVRGIQSQHLAYSHDRGRTFGHYAGNPIIDLDMADFRDPKVFHHAESGAWVMVVALAREHRVQFYRSQNLLDWTLAGSFGPAGSTSGQWECPDLFLVPVDGRPGETAWVLKVDVDVGLTDGGSGAQYFVGAFDGHRFTVDPVRGSAHGDLVEQGPDFYAAITWSGLPVSQPGPVWIGWQSNHQTGRYYPTDPWRGAMSLPRRLFLHEQGGRLLLGQVPIIAGDAMPEPQREQVALDRQPTLLSSGSTAFECRFALSAQGEAQAAFTLADHEAVLLTVLIDFAEGTIDFRRHESDLVSVPGFDHHSTVCVPVSDGVALHVVVDGLLVEIFLNDGRVVYSGSIFPKSPPQASVTGTSGAVRLTGLSCRSLEQSMLF